MVVMGSHVFLRESCSKVALSVQTERVKRRHDDFVGLTKRDEVTGDSRLESMASF